MEVSGAPWGAYGAALNPGHKIKLQGKGEDILQQHRQAVKSKSDSIKSKRGGAYRKDINVMTDKGRGL